MASYSHCPEPYGAKYIPGRTDLDVPIPSRAYLWAWLGGRAASAGETKGGAFPTVVSAIRAMIAGPDPPGCMIL
jgi:hypothetical protein